MARVPNAADFGIAYMETLSPGSTRYIERLGTPKGVSLALFPSFRETVVFVEDDFIEDTISSTRWNLSTDASATAFAWSSAAGGKISGTTGTTDNGYLAINGDVIWSGDKRAGTAIRFKIDVVTSFTFELGFTDALADETLPAITDIDTPATGNGATDVACIHLDTDQTLTTAAFAGESTGSAYAAQKVNLGTWSPTAATWYTAIVQLNIDNAACAIYDTNVAGSPALVASGSLKTVLEGGTLVRPHFIFGTRNTTAKVPDIDFIRVWQDR